MFYQAVVAFLAFAFTFVQSAPTAALDAATLLKNGQEAQNLNAQFKTIKLSDACGGTGLTAACVGNAISNCVNNAWNSTNGACSKSQQCFAIPNVQSNGTTLTCTSEKNALSVINASGAKGGIAGADASGSTNGTDSSSSSDPSSSSTAVEPSGATPSPSPESSATPTVTVTVTVTPNATTLPATIRTLSPQEASSALSSILAQGTSIPSSASATSIDSASPTATTSLPPSTIILLTAAPETSASASLSASASTASTSASTTIILLTAASETSVPPSLSASAAAASISASSDSSGGYGYGGY
ncbi:hypothetical protein M413DRAFT_444619 [Hebeloma cylindrosporum]|uniref:Carbohydrate-binding module family 19 domain-containing protein n=1 Tax=Hebeloma cylindrosporum TaxID=76867 RepID=A0A0C2YME0_HEBCY|nr:hypothetical protein M413DRAFT_444619 [Hebeloma cylindrosporum h7]